ncbi:MAG TPA: hypothetical protein GX695_00505, partial [Acholeplasmataceae bacterium]|nr:hypothetical protein [Acholeplasmataceae bacterium]
MLNTKYFNKIKKSWILDKAKCKFKHDFNNKQIIIIYDNNNVFGFLEFQNDWIKMI